MESGHSSDSDQDQAGPSQASWVKTEEGTWEMTAAVRWRQAQAFEKHKRKRQAEERARRQEAVKQAKERAKRQEARDRLARQVVDAERQQEREERDRKQEDEPRVDSGLKYLRKRKSSNTERWQNKLRRKQKRHCQSVADGHDAKQAVTEAEDAQTVADEYDAKEAYWVAAVTANSQGGYRFGCTN